MCEISLPPDVAISVVFRSHALTAIYALSIPVSQCSLIIRIAYVVTLGSKHGSNNPPMSTDNSARSAPEDASCATAGREGGICIAAKAISTEAPMITAARPGKSPRFVFIVGARRI